MARIVLIMLFTILFTNCSHDSSESELNGSIYLSPSDMGNTNQSNIVYLNILLENTSNRDLFIDYVVGYPFQILQKRYFFFYKDITMNNNIKCDNFSLPLWYPPASSSWENRCEDSDFPHIRDINEIDTLIDSTINAKGIYEDSLEVYDSLWWLLTTRVYVKRHEVIKCCFPIDMSRLPKGQYKIVMKYPFDKLSEFIEWRNDVLAEYDFSFLKEDNGYQRWSGSLETNFIEFEVE